MFCFGNWSMRGCACGAPVHLQNFGINDIVKIIGEYPRNINDIIKLTILKDDPGVFQTLAPHLLVDWIHVIKLAASRRSYSCVDYFIKISNLNSWELDRIFAEVCLDPDVQLEKIETWINNWPPVVARLYRKNYELHLLNVNVRTQDGELKNLISQLL